MYYYIFPNDDHDDLANLKIKLQCYCIFCQRRNITQKKCVICLHVSGMNKERVLKGSNEASMYYNGDISHGGSFGCIH